MYVDDILVASSSNDVIVELKGLLSREFKVKNLGTPKFFLGIEIARNSSGISLFQRKYALDILADTGMLASKASTIPMDPSVHLSQTMCTLLENPTSYRALIGLLLYLTITRPYITFAVNRLSQFLSAPTDFHMQTAHKILRYLKSNPGQGLFYAADTEMLSLMLIGPHARIREHLSLVCVLMLASHWVSWKSKKQDTMSRSSI